MSPWSLQQCLVIMVRSSSVSFLQAIVEMRWAPTTVIGATSAVFAFPKTEVAKIVHLSLLIPI